VFRVNIKLNDAANALFDIVFSGVCNAIRASSWCWWNEIA
jgi:hypothetical protein